MKDVETRKLLEKYGSPLYVYREGILDDSCIRIKRFTEELKSRVGRDISMHYSPKANSNPVVLRAAKKHGLKVDCMSPGEFYINEKCGFDIADMLYVCNNIKVSEMRFIHEKGILPCFDSVSQVNTWGENFPGTDIMVRINPGIIGVGHSEKVNTAGEKAKFGICEDNIPKLLETAKKHNLHIKGTHQHLGSLFLNDKIPDYIAGVIANLKIVKKYFPYIEIVDLGGGFGVPYEPEEDFLDLSLLSDQLVAVLKEFITGCQSVKEFKFEPGRYIACQAGELIGTVTAVEQRFKRIWVGTDIGMGILVRPSMYGSYHQIVLPEAKGDSEEILCDVCGDVCESGDVLGREHWLELPQIGEPVKILDVGAYGYAMASNYTGRTRPAEVLINKNGEYTLIRKPETIEQIYQNIVWDNISF